MFQEERLNRITEHIRKKQKVTVKELSNILNISEVTVRKDLNKLEKMNLLIKTHGGAISNEYDLFEKIPASVKSQINLTEKKIVAKLAITQIQEGDIFILDSGTTVLELAKIIKNMEGKVFTNDLKIALEISLKPKLQLTVSGGDLISDVHTLVDYNVNNIFEMIKVSKLFMSCDGISFDFGVSCRNAEEFNIKTSMINAAEEVILLADNSKISKKSLKKICDLSVIDKIIIDKIGKSEKIEFENNGIEVITQ